MMLSPDVIPCGSLGSKHQLTFHDAHHKQCFWFVIKKMTSSDLYTNNINYFALLSVSLPLTLYIRHMLGNSILKIKTSNT